MKTKKLHLDLPGHGDEVFAVDWSPDSQRVVSGGRDKILKLWVDQPLFLFANYFIQFLVDFEDVRIYF